MVVYVDIAFLLNCLTDGAALYATGRLSGLPVGRRRLLAAALLGGTYGVLCVLPGWGALASLPLQAAAAAGLVWTAFGRRGLFLRQLLLFFILSCALSGALVAGGQILAGSACSAGREGAASRNSRWSSGAGPATPPRDSCAGVCWSTGAEGSPLPPCWTRGTPSPTA